MPITRRQFELEINPAMEEWMSRIYDLLHAHKDEAFTEAELEASLGLPAASLEDRLLGQGRISLVLDRLVDLKGAVKRVVAGIAYYAAGHRLKKGEWSEVGGKPVKMDWGWR